MKNKVSLIGNVGKDPEIKNFDGGRMMATFSLATTEKYKDKSGEVVKDTQWHNIVVWNNLCKVVEGYVHKGTLIAVEGKIRYRNYEDKDGIKRYATDIVVSELVLLPSSQGTGASQESKPEEKSNDPKGDDMPPPPKSDDLPF